MREMDERKEIHLVPSHYPAAELILPKNMSPHLSSLAHAFTFKSHSWLRVAADRQLIFRQPVNDLGEIYVCGVFLCNTYWPSKVVLLNLVFSPRYLVHAELNRQHPRGSEHICQSIHFNLLYIL
jgi:hypothetical protein